jgi:hypothetical protein
MDNINMTIDKYKFTKLNIITDSHENITPDPKGDMKLYTFSHFDNNYIRNKKNKKET